MNSNKRRAVCKDMTQTRIQFPQQKLLSDQMNLKLDYSGKVQNSQFNFNQQSGAFSSTCSTPYRSLNRIQALIKNTPSQEKPSQSKQFETPQKYQYNYFLRSEISKPSSATTACTYAPNEYSTIKINDLVPPTRKKRESKSDKKNQNSKQLTGTKRPAQMKLDHMEYFVRLQSSTAKFIAKNLRLKDKKTGMTYDFPIFDEKNLEGFKNHPVIKECDMTKLEVEYDYETDDEQLKHSAKMLILELQQAIDFFIKEDPFKLVDNILL